MQLFSPVTVGYLDMSETSAEAKPSLEPPRPPALPEKVAETAISDTARYQEQLLKMILHHDDRALRVLTLYVTVLGALVTTAFALNQAHALNSYAGIAMGGAALSVFVGCGFAYRAAWTARIYLPGRKPDFWTWGLDNELDIRETARAYAQQAVEIIANNERIADRAANRLARAHLCGIAAPFIGTALALFAYVSRTYIT
jgi:hypothetical protein